MRVGGEVDRRLDVPEVDRPAGLPGAGDRAVDPLQHSCIGVSSSGDGTSGIGSWWSSPSAGVWNDAIIDRIGAPRCSACVRRAEKELPSRSFSTLNSIGSLLSPGRRKYPCMEWAGAPLGHRAAGRDERLREDLPAVHAAVRLRLAAPDEQVVQAVARGRVQRAQVENVDQVVQRVHPFAPRPLGALDTPGPAPDAGKQALSPGQP